MTDDLRNAITSLLADIREMRTQSHKVDEPSSWYGGFPDCRDHEAGCFIEWPNLTISAERVRKLLES